MQWTDGTNAGFTTGKAWRPPDLGFIKRNVLFQSTAPNSLLSFYRELIRIRNNHAALRVGDFTLINSGHRSVFASLRLSREETVLVLVNMSPLPVKDYALTVQNSPLSGNYTVTPLLGYGESPALQVDEQGGFANYLPMLEIPANGRFILQLRKVTQ
jgi:glycosidase